MVKQEKGRSERMERSWVKNVQARAPAATARRQRSDGSCAGTARAHWRMLYCSAGVSAAPPLEKAESWALVSGRVMRGVVTGL